MMDPFEQIAAMTGASIGETRAEASHMMNVEEYSHTPAQLCDTKRCPVFCTVDSEGVRHFSSYLFGSIRDTEHYIDLIDTLLIAREQDIYTIYIDSPGGLIASGGFISSAIHHSKATVYTVSRGICASAGALIHSAAHGDNAKVSPISIHMYHMSSHCDSGCSALIAKRAEQQVRYVNQCLLNKAFEEGHLTQDEFDRIQGGEEIYVSGARFTQHREDALAQKQTVLMDTPAQAIPSMQAYDMSVDTRMHGVSTYPFFMSREEMAAVAGNAPAEDLLIRTSDQIHFRVYMRSQSQFDSKYVTKLTRFLDSRVEGQSVTFILGTKMDDYNVVFIGPLVAAMQDCKANIITIAAGYCSTGESFLWLYGHERLMYRYGALSFDTFPIVNACPEYRLYFGVLFAQAITLGVLTQEDVDGIIKTHVPKMILSHELTSHE